MHFIYIWMTSSPEGRTIEPIYWLKIFLDSRLLYESLEGLTGFLTFLIQSSGKISRNQLGKYP